MPNYIRAQHGTTYFFTVVTYQRREILCLEPCRTILREAIHKTKQRYPFTNEAFVLFSRPSALYLATSGKRHQLFIAVGIDKKGIYQAGTTDTGCYEEHWP